MAEPVREARLTVVSGGQTGVDRAALEVARELGLAVHGWCPAGGWAEDLTEPPGLLARFPELRPTPTADPEERTRRNVRDSDAVLVLVPAGGWVSPGTRLTTEVAEALGRPCLVTDVPTRGQDRAAVGVAAWLSRVTRDRTAFALDVAGPRESEAPGIQAAAATVLRHALAAFVTLR